MPYSTSNPPALVSQRVGADGGAIWILKTTDDLSAVTANGYVSNATELGVKAGDKLIHIDTTNGVVNDLTFAAPNTAGTASGALCSAIEPVGETSIALDSAGTGTILVDDIIKFDNDPVNEYRVTTGDTDVSDGGTIVITPALVTATAVGTGITVQSAELTLRGNGVGRVLSAASTLTAADSGGTYFLSLAGGFTTTLPAPKMGLKYKFIVAVAPTTAYIVATNGSANIIHGQVGTSEDAAGDVACAAASDTITFVASTAIIGDWVSVESDGTNWYVNGMCDVQDAITTTQAT